VGSLRSGGARRWQAAGDELDAGRPAADHGERQPATALCLVARLGGVLQAREHLVAQPLRLRQRLHAERGRGQRGVAEVVVLAAGREHQVVELDVVAAAGVHDPALEVDAGNIGVEEVDVAGCPEGSAKRIRDVRRGQQRACHLVEQRRDLVVVAPVDQQDIDRPAGEPARACQPADATADDDHPGPGHAATLQAASR
jgi:hypothetical protein